MNRRGFLQAFAATASGLLLPEPRRVYSFAQELRIPTWEDYVSGGTQADFESALIAAPFGDGSDGDFVGDTLTLTRDSYYRNITARVVNVGNFRLYVAGTLDLSGFADARILNGAA